MRITLISTAVLAFSLFGLAQDTEQQRVPTTLTADVPAAVAGETKKENQLSLGFDVSSVYNDNIFLTRSNRQGDWRYLAAPSISLTETRPRFNWNLQYLAGVSRYLTLPMGTQSSHELSGMLELKLTPRLRLRMRQDYIRSVDPFSTFDNSLPSLGIANSPNNTVLSSAAIRTALTSLAEIEYATSPHGKLGFSGTFTKSDYSNVLNSTNSLAPMAGNTVHGSAYYSHQMTARSSVGVQYVLEDMTYQHSPNRVRTHSALLFTTIGFDAHSSVMLYAGPQYSQTQGLTLAGEESLPTLARKREWTPVIGGTYSWVGSRTSFNLDALRKVNDGGGVLFASLVTEGSFSVGRKLARRWDGRMGFTIGNNESTGLFATDGTLRTVIANATITRNFTDTFSLAVTYNRVYENGTASFGTVGNENRFQFSLRYSMTRPLGK